MKKVIYILFLAAITACGGNGGNGKKANQGVVFAPKQQETAVVTKGPAAKQTDPVLSFVGQVKLMIMIPEAVPQVCYGTRWLR